MMNMIWIRQAIVFIAIMAITGVSIAQNKEADTGWISYDGEPVFENIDTNVVEQFGFTITYEESTAPAILAACFIASSVLNIFLIIKLRATTRRELAKDSNNTSEGICR